MKRNSRKPPSEPGRRSARPAGLLLGALLAAGFFSCAPSTDPVDLLCEKYDGAARILRDAETDGPAKKEKLETYWAGHQAEIERLRDRLAGEMQAADTPEARAAFVRRVERFLVTVREVQRLLREQGVEL